MSLNPGDVGLKINDSASCHRTSSAVKKTASINHHFWKWSARTLVFWIKHFNKWQRISFCSLSA